MDLDATGSDLRLAGGQAASPDLSARDAIVAEARSWIGTPYHHQASLKGIGCDCLGLLRGVWRARFGEEPETPPAYSRDWAEAHSLMHGGRETLAEAAGRHMVAIQPADARPGDVLLFAVSDNAPAKHCAIVTVALTVAWGATFARSLDDGRMIHAIETHPVAEVAIGPWWRRRIRFAFAFRED